MSGGSRVTERPTVFHAHSGNLYGGVETALVTLARHPGRWRHVFALCYEGRLSRELSEAGAPVEMLGEVRFSRPWSIAGARRRLARILAAARPAAVLCHSPWSLAAFGPVARSQGLPVLLWAHTAFTGRHWLERLARLLAPPDFAICNSEYTRAALPRAFPGIPTTVVYPPVAPPPRFDPARRAAKREAHGAGTGTVVVTLVARMEPGKGHNALIQALRELWALPGWVAWIVGGAQRRSEHAYRAQLERTAHEAGLGARVHFLGQRDDVAALLWASDLYCQPNTGIESFGQSFVEALYARLPVIGPDLGGPREIVTPDCGLLIPPGDRAALVEALRLLITDPDLRRRLGAAGPARAAYLCAPEHAIPRLEAALERALSSPAQDGNLNS
jgi:glycosyltransferase involved in cell wall biosynthesis